MPGPDAAQHLDVLIVGAGISGIDAAYHLQKRCPGKSCAILEARDAIGGTWDLFRYPGIRSDSDMYTLGFPFRPWTGDKAIADGADIRAYVEETARAFGIDRRSASATGDARRLVVRRGALDGRGRDARGRARRFTCAFLFLGSGYYDYEQGYRPRMAGRGALIAAASSIRNSGPRTSTMRASGSS